jgi:hypothetical protein
MPANGETVDSSAQMQAVIQQMDPYRFEHFIADLWTKMGWKTEVPSATGDKGVDVIARQSMPYDQLLLIQTKRYGPQSTVGSPDVQQYASLRHQFEGVDKVLIVTTNEFTRQAKEAADQLNVKLINGNKLAYLIDEHNALDIVAEYLDFVEPAGVADTSTTEPAVSDTETEEMPVQGPAPAPTSESTARASPGKAIMGNESTPTSNAAVSPVAEAPADDTETHTSSTQPSRLAPIAAIHSVTNSFWPASVTPWQVAIWACLLGWVAVVVGIGSLSTEVWALLFLGSWLGLPVAIYQDSQAIGDSIEWPKYNWAYTLGASVWLVSLLVCILYLWRRHHKLN